MGQRKIPWFLFTLVGTVLFLSGCSTAAPTSSPDEAPAYFGMKSPGPAPELFAPGLLPPDGALMHSSPSFSPDGTEVYFSAFFPAEQPRIDVIMFMEWDDEGWGSAQIADFSGEYNDNWPWFSPDGQRLYFSSQRPLEAGGESAADYGLWYVERQASGWSAPRQIASPQDFGRDEGTLFLAANLPGGYGDLDIYQLEFQDGTYSLPHNLGPIVNTLAEEYGPCAAPDRSFLIFTRFDETQEQKTDLYVTFQRAKDTWTEPQNMGAGMPAFQGGRFPGLSPDGDYIFYVDEGGKAVYWVAASVMEEFSPGP